MFYGLSIENPAKPPEQTGVNCDVSITREIQWAFHFRYKPKLVKGSVWKRLCCETAVCIKITLYCFDMSEAKVKIIFLLDIVSVLLPHRGASI